MSRVRLPRQGGRSIKEAKFSVCDMDHTAAQIHSNSAADDSSLDDLDFKAIAGRQQPEFAQTYTIPEERSFTLLMT